MLAKSGKAVDLTKERNDVLPDGKNQLPCRGAIAALIESNCANRCAYFAVQKLATLRSDAISPT